MATRNLLERANLILEGYFLALYVPLGGSKSRMENTPSESMKFYISMFSDKPPCMPLCFGTVVIIPPEAAEAFLSFLASAATSFSLLAFIEATFSLLASTTTTFCSFVASKVAAFTFFLASTVGAFSSDFSSCLAFFFFYFLFFLRLFLQLFFFLRLSLQPGWVM